MNSNQSCKHYILSGRYTKIASVKKHGQYNDVSQKILLYKNEKKKSWKKEQHKRLYASVFGSSLAW